MSFPQKLPMSGLAQAEESRLLNQSSPIPRPYRNPTEERMMWQYQFLVLDNKDESQRDKPKYTILTRQFFYF